MNKMCAETNTQKRSGVTANFFLRFQIYSKKLS